MPLLREAAWCNLMVSTRGGVGIGQVYQYLSSVSDTSCLSQQAIADQQAAERADQGGSQASGEPQGSRGSAGPSSASGGSSARQALLAGTQAANLAASTPTASQQAASGAAASGCRDSTQRQRGQQGEAGRHDSRGALLVDADIVMTQQQAAAKVRIPLKRRIRILWELYLSLSRMLAF